MKTLVAVLALALASPALAESAPAKADPKAETPKIKSIRKLLQLTGAAQLGGQVMAQMLESFKTTLPQVPATFWPELAKELNPDELVELVIPIYDRQLGDDEIKQLIAFYETPVGRKLIKVMPVITQESMQAGQEWGRQVGAKVMRKLQQQGLLEGGKKDGDGKPKPEAKPKK